MRLDAADLRVKEVSQFLDGLGINPADDLLPLTLGADQSGALQFPQMMRDGGGGDIQLLADVSDTDTGLPVGHEHRAGGTAVGQHAEDLQAVAVGQRLEHLGKHFGTISFC